MTTAETRVVHVHDNVPGAVYIGRKMTARGLKASPLANPFRIWEHGRADAIARYGDWLSEQIESGNAAVIDALIAARGKPLACWCRRDGQPRSPGTICHGDMILDFLLAYSDDELRAPKGATTP